MFKIENSKFKPFLAVLIFYASIIFFIQLNHSQNMNHINISGIPLNIEEWQGEELPVEQNVKDILETDGVIIRRYKKLNKRAIDLVIVYYKNSRVALHLPEDCLLGQGSRLIDRETEKIQETDGKNFSLNKLTVKTKNGNHTVIYYYETTGLRTNNYVFFWLKRMINKIRYGTKSGALIRFSIANFSGSESKFDDSLKILNSFINKASPVITKCLF
ncbi:MAG: exosortase C-terminal domain/associated protein EpsI [Nanoarchaeota archaeon]